MISYIVGNPGSGKTYFAVNKLYTAFISPKKQQNSYILAYTNINEFDFKQSEKIKPLNFDKLYDDLIALYNLYIIQATDKELIKKARDLKLFKVLIVVDECHNNIFSKPKDKVIIWWLTYHRHLYQDLIFITQNLSLVGSEYKKIAEFFYKAVDGSKRLFFKKFRYVLFNSPTMYHKKDIVPGGGVSLKFNDEIFKLYHSGNITKHKSYLKFYFLICFIIFLIIMFLFAKFKNSFLTENNNTKQNQQVIYSQSNHAQILQTKPKKENLKFTHYEIICILEKCHFVGLKTHFLKTGFLYAISNSNPKFYKEVYKERSKNISYYYITYDAPYEYFENLKNINVESNSNETYTNSNTIFGYKPNSSGN